MKNTIRARVTTTITSTDTFEVELPVITKKLLEMPPAELVYELWEQHCIKEDCEVGILVSDVPAGVAVRKPHGEQEYLRADDDWFRRTTELEEERVLMVADGYRMSLMEGHKTVVAMLSDLYGCQWDLVEQEINDLHCSK